MMQKNKSKEMRASELLRLSLKSMRAKKTRTQFTIIGVALGVGIIIFLLSIGYGLQNLVVSEVASLEALKIADVISGDLKTIKINDEALEKFKENNSVEKIAPIVSLVGRAHFENSVSDIVIFGATRDYFELSDVNLLAGDFYQDNEIKAKEILIKKENEKKKETKKDNQLDKVSFKNIIKNSVKFNIKNSEWIKVREEPKLGAKILGYTKANSKWLLGKEVLGSAYLSKENFGKILKDEKGKWFGKWILADVLLWQKKGNVFEPLFGSNNQQIGSSGYFGENGIVLEKDIRAEVVNQNSDSLVEKTKVENQDKKLFPVVINQQTSEIMGIIPEEIIGEEISFSFLITKLLGEKIEDNIETQEKNFKIIGVILEGENPQAYIPLTFLREMGVDNFSQVKIKVKNESDLLKIRETVENMGYQTASVADTVLEINQVFKWTRAGLLGLGFLALVIAMIGMFNTMTVSLLERTKEIGVMKAIGMKRKEVAILFLGEAWLMGVVGGILGLLLGFVFGKIFDVVLNIFFIPGTEFVTISIIPLSFSLGVIVFTLIISLFTGIYPARRATKISPLSAIRYE